QPDPLPEHLVPPARGLEQHRGLSAGPARVRRQPLYRHPEDAFLDRVAAALPDAGYDGRAQFATMLPLAALFSGILSLGFAGIGALSSLLAAALAGSPFALALIVLLAGPPILWLGSFFLLQKRRRAGWRMFALASVLATVWAISSLQIFQLAFDLLFVYAAIQARDAYRY